MSVGNGSGVWSLSLMAHLYVNFSSKIPAIDWYSDWFCSFWSRGVWFIYVEKPGNISTFWCNLNSRQIVSHFRPFRCDSPSTLEMLPELKILLFVFWLRVICIVFRTLEMRTICVCESYVTMLFSRSYPLFQERDHKSKWHVLNNYSLHFEWSRASRTNAPVSLK